MHQEKTIETIATNKTTPKIILLIDDDEDEHEIFLSALQNIDSPFNFVSTDNCEEALDILKQLDPDYIFVDFNMPRLNGMTCLEEIKKINRIAHVPVYMYSTGINAQEGKKALQMGAVDYIIKPNSISTLSAMLKKILN
jgi:PleD family two-component response regulator